MIHSFILTLLHMCRTELDVAHWYLLIVCRAINNAQLRYTVRRYNPGCKVCEVTEEGLRRYLAVASCDPFNGNRDRFRDEGVDFEEADVPRCTHKEDAAVVMLSFARTLWDMLPGVCYGELHRTDIRLPYSSDSGDMGEERLRLKKEIVAAAAVRVAPGRRKLLEDLREGSTLWIKRQEKYQQPWEKKVADGIGRMMGHMADAVEGRKETDAFHASFQFQRALGNAGGYGVVRCNPLASHKLPRDKPVVVRKRGRPAKKACKWLMHQH